MLDTTVVISVALAILIADAVIALVKWAVPIIKETKYPSTK